MISIRNPTEIICFASCMEKTALYNSLQPVGHWVKGQVAKRIWIYAKTEAGKKQLISVIKKDSWEKPAIFAELVKRGADEEGMWGTFNMGIGFVLAVAADKADEIIAHFNKNAAKFTTDVQKSLGIPDMKAYKIGYVDESDKDLGSELKGSHEATKLI